MGGTCSWMGGTEMGGACWRGDGAMKRGGGEMMGGELTGVAE